MDKKNKSCEDKSRDPDALEVTKEAYYLDILGKRIVVTESHSSNWMVVQGSTLIEVYDSRRDAQGNDHWFMESQDYRSTFVGELGKGRVDSSISNKLANLIFAAVKEYGVLMEKWKEYR